MIDLDLNQRIVNNPEICSGKTVIRGTRIMVKNILSMVAGGYTTAQIIDAHPELTNEDVSAALNMFQSLIIIQQDRIRIRRPNYFTSLVDQFLNELGF